MPGIVPMVAPGNARVVGETVLALPDPERVTSDPTFRSGVARHATATLILMEVQAIAPPLAVRAPAVSAARRIEVPPVGTSSITTLLELSPLPPAPMRAPCSPFAIDRPRWRTATPDAASNYRAGVTVPLTWS